MDVLEHFDDRAEDWDKLYERSQFVDRRALFLDAVQRYAPADGAILDYGCGTGRIATDLSLAGFAVLGVDGSKRMIEEATRKAEGKGNLAFEAIDPENWQPQAAYDAIVCSSVIEYVPDDAQLLATLSAGLVPGGTLVISIPSSATLFAVIEDRLLTGKRDVSFARRRYSSSEFGEMLNAVGLQSVKEVTFELPRLGKLGVWLSRLPVLGMMRLVIATKTA